MSATSNSNNNNTAEGLTEKQMKKALESIVVQTVERPRAIALVLGPLSISIDGLKRLSKFYLQRQCSVVAVLSPPRDFFLTQHHALQPIATVALQKVATLLSTSSTAAAAAAEPAEEEVPSSTLAATNESSSSSSSLPVVIHMFSNGGTFMLEEMTRPAHVGTDEYKLVQKRLQYIFYDSCPCYLHMPWNLSFKYFGDAFPFPGWSSIGRKFYLLGAATSLSAWTVCTLSPYRSYDFWQAMQNPMDCSHYIYAYSTDDKVTDAARIDELIETQRTEYHKDVTSYRYTDCGHVQIFSSHEEEYDKAIDDALQGALDRAAAASTAAAGTAEEEK